jgi:diguanylate cyclase (GGDEF)-like protein
MAPAADIGSDKARRPARRLIGPLAIVIFAAVVLCVVVAAVLARQSDLRHQQQQRASLIGVVDEFRAAFGEFSARLAGGIAADSSVAGAGARIASHLVPSGAALYRHDAAFVVDAGGHLIAAYPSGITDVPPGVQRLAAVAASSEYRLAGGEPAAVTDFIVSGERLAIAAAATIGRSASGATLVSVAALDPRLVAVLEKTSGVEALRFDTEPAHTNRDVMSLMDAQGRIVGWMAWTAQSPTLAAITRMMPLLVLVAACFIGFVGLAIRQAQRSSRELAAREAEAIRTAGEDSLTGLPNRGYILEELDRALAMPARDGVVAFAYFDLDGFKDVNEALGHQAGDQLLVFVAERIAAATRGAGVLGRLGSDEFALVVRADDVLAAVQTAHAAIGAMTHPFWIGGQPLQIGLTVGLAHAPRDGVSRDDLTRRADLALRSAKRHSRGRAITFEPAMEAELHDRRFVNRELRRTLAEGGLDVHYQPIVAADGQHVVGVEALLRWKHPTRGDIPPATFVPIAEQSGLMPKLGEFVLKRALTDALKWTDTYIAVNVSPVQMRDRFLVEQVAGVIRDTGIDPGRVVLEVTEGVLIDNPDEAHRRLEQLRALGLRIALDDFGSGYSSLSYLRRFPIDKLKIDREFVIPLGRSGNGGVIIQAIIALGRALGLSVLCEGVETEEQRILLRLAGCDEMQGFLFARPGPSRAIDRLLGVDEETRTRRAAEHGAA